VRIFNLISDTPDTVSLSIQVECYDISTETSVTTADPFGFNEVSGINVPLGQKNFLILNEDGTDTLTTYTSESLEPGFEHYLYITGPVESPVVDYNKMVPLEVRNK